MVNFDDLYVAHIEQLSVRYPDAEHIRRAWAIDIDQIESKVFLADEEALVFVSFFAPDGTIRHMVRPYEPHHVSA